MFGYGGGWSRSVRLRVARGGGASQRSTQGRSQRPGGRSVVHDHRRRLGYGNLFIGHAAGFGGAGHYRLGHFARAFRFNVAGVVTAKVIAAVAFVVIMNVVGVGAVGQPLLNDNGDILINGARVGLLFVDPKFRQQFENLVWLDFELSRQLIDSDFLLHS